MAKLKCFNEFKFISENNQKKDDYSKKYEDRFFVLKYNDYVIDGNYMIIYCKIYIKFKDIEFYGKFVYDKNNMLSYYIFDVDKNKVDINDGDEFNDIIDDYSLQDDIYDMSQKIKNN